MNWQAETFEKVTIRAIRDVRPAAIAIKEIAADLDLRIAATADIAAKGEATVSTAEMGAAVLAELERLGK